MRSVSLKLSILYIFLAIFNISFFTIIIFENQIDLITETSKYQTKEFANSIYSQIESLRWEILPGEEILSEERILQYIKEICDDMLRDYIIFTETGRILYQSRQDFTLDRTHMIDAQKALAKKEFMGQLYYSKIVEEKYEILFYIPLYLGIQYIEEPILLFKLEMKDINKRLTTLYYLVILIIVIIAIFHVLFAFFLNRLIIAPIKALSKKSTDISKGNLSARVSLKSKDEIGQLGKTFNMMADSIQETITKLDEQNKQMRFELVMANAVQQSIYPGLRQTKYFDIAIYHQPYMEVSGDYHNIIHLGSDKYGILVADVSGHGVAAALITMLIKDKFEEIALKYSDPAQLLTHINVLFKDLMIEFEKYFTAFYLIINKNEKLIFSNAAHPKAYLLRSGKFLPLTVKGALIGMSHTIDNAFNSKSIDINPGDRLLLYTDGIIDSINEKEEEYGFERLLKVALKNTHLSCTGMLHNIIADFQVFRNGTEQTDDETLIIIEIKK